MARLDEWFEWVDANPGKAMLAAVVADALILLLLVYAVARLVRAVLADG